MQRKVAPEQKGILVVRFARTHVRIMVLHVPEIAAAFKAFFALLKQL